MTMTKTDVAYLGPQGTFAHLVASKRYPRRRLVPQGTITDVFRYVEDGKHRTGVVPIENSSGGTIYATVDRLIDKTCPLMIQEQLSINVKLALIGRKRERISVLFSHFAPFHHCNKWIHQHLPNVERREAASTAEAVKLAASERNAAALATRRAASLYGLDVLEFPIAQKIPNVTQFLAVGHKPGDTARKSKTSLVVSLKNCPGSLCSFLEAFKNAEVNLTRILSRPIAGCPNAYIFLVDIEGTKDRASVEKALDVAKQAALTVRTVGIYSVHRPYVS